MKITLELLLAAMALESFKPGILRYLFWTALVELLNLATGSVDSVED